MRNWLELETRFRALLPLAQHLRIDYQWGAAGEHFHVSGMSHGTTVTHFNGLAQIAGEFLKDILPDSEQTRPILVEAYAQKRWLRAMKEWSGEL